MNTSWSWRGWLAVGAAGVVLATMLAVAAIGARVLGIATAFYAKTLCSGVLLSGRAENVVVAEDIRPKLRRLPDRFTHDIERSRSLVSVDYMGLFRRQALHRPGLGCTLMLDTDRGALLRQSAGLPPAAAVEDLPLAVADTPEASRLAVILAEAFTELGEGLGRGARAIVVLHRDRIAAERYAEGIAPDTPLVGWSMGKTVVNALIGRLVQQGRLSRDTSSLFPEWRGARDVRSSITVAHLLSMTSGLDFGAGGETLLSPVREMLFARGDAASQAVAAPSIAPPDASWRYGSGDTLLLCRLLRQTVGDGAPALAFARNELFSPLGMASAVMEADASGTPLGAAFVHASARDWARFGQFLMQDGVWQGRRLLPEGWLAFSTEASRQSTGAYGAHLWRRTPSFLRPEGAPDIALPEDRLLMLGIDGQMVAVVPSLELVVVRLGMTTRRAAFDPDRLLADVIAALAAPSG